MNRTAHKWGQCHQNQYGDNFRSRRQSPNESYLSHLSSTTSRSSSRSNYSTRHRPPSQVHMAINTSDQPLIPTATSACRVAPITPTPILDKIEMNTDKGTHTTSVTAWIITTIPQMITYLKEHWAYTCSTTVPCPYSDYVYSTREVQVRSLMSVLYPPTTVQDWVMANKNNISISKNLWRDSNNILWWWPTAMWSI